MKNYFKKLFNGEISLITSFWVWFVFIILLIEYFFEADFSQDVYGYNATNSNISIGLNILILIYSIFIAIVIFRSSKNYVGKKIFPILAQILVGINLILSINVSIDDIKYTFFEDYLLGIEIKKFQKELPLRVDLYSELIDIKKEKTDLTYTYKLYDLEKEDIDENKFKNQIQSSICEDENNIFLLKKDYILNYKYINKDEKEIIKIVTNKNSCGKDIYDLDILKKILREEKKL